MVRSIQESQIYLESEFNALKKSQPTLRDTERLNNRTPNTKHSSQSPLKVKFEREPTDSEDDRFPPRRRQEDNSAQASPYSPPRNKSRPSLYQETDLTTRVHTDGDYLIKREDGRASSFINLSNNRSAEKKYEPLQTEPASRDLVSSCSAQKPRQKAFEDSPNKDWRNSSAQKPIKTTFFETHSSLEPPKELPNESSTPSVFPKSEQPRAFGMQDPAILQSKQKIREDIDK